ACFDAIVGFDAGDPYSRPEPPDDPRDVAVRGLRLGWLPRVGNRLVDPEVLAACEAAVRHLEDGGAHVETLQEDVSAFERTFLISLQAGLAARVGPHMAKFGDKVATSLRESIERGARWSAVDWANALGQRTAVYRRVQALFRRFDFLLSPTLSRPALAVDHDPYEPITIAGEPAGSIRGAWYPYLWPFNLSGHPALSLPCGFASDGLPIGLQIVGPWYGDRRVLALAARLEGERPCARAMPLSPKGFPVLLTFDIDAETMWTARDPKNAERPIVMSQGAYGWKVGMPRILDLLARYGLRVTFFVPGLVMEQ